MTLQSPGGNIIFNAATGDRYLLNPAGCEMGADLRVTRDNIPQADGFIIHHAFEEGYVCTLQIELWEGEVVACDEALVRMLDNLNRSVRALLNAGDNEGRLIWTPSGEVNRMLDDIRLSERLRADNDGIKVTVEFQIHTQYPYAQDEAQTTTALNATITNTGTAPYWPVFQVFGFGPWLLTNVTTGLEILYNGGGSGSYVEVDTFRNTLYADGSGANLMRYLDVATSDFWPLEVGANICTIAGGPTCDVLWAPAWS
jgi:hypothetical protein